jgi:hypothetical protein
MRFVCSVLLLGRWILLKSSNLRKCRVFPLAALPLIALLCNCTGITSQSSGSSDTFRLSGTISPQSVGSGANIALNGPIQAATIGDSSGNYSFSGLPNGAYVVTPSLAGYTLAPSVAKVSINGSDVVGIDFTASQESSHSVQLSWHASTTNAVGYNIYRSTTSGGPYIKINTSLVTALTYNDATVVNSTTYYYVTTAVDSAGIESVFSNQATVKVP